MAAPQSTSRFAKPVLSHSVVSLAFVNQCVTKLFEKPFTHGMIVLFFSFSLMAVVNALLLQKNHHTNGVDSAAIPLPPVRIDALNTAKLLAPPDEDKPVSFKPSSQLSKLDGKETNSTGLSTGNAPASIITKAVSKPQPAQQKTTNDPIAQLLNAPVGSAPTSLADNGANQALTSKTILSAERALQRLGYVVPTDGKLSPATHSAVAQFEHDRKMPVHGELTPPVLSALANEAGLAIN